MSLSAGEKEFRSFIQSAESLHGTGFVFRFLKRNRVIILPAPYNNSGQPNLTAIKLWGLSDKERRHKELREPKMTRRESHNHFRKYAHIYKKLNASSTLEEK
jgi:hypothetical protein